MGQTQILMIVLAVIIIGIAITVGITQFGESSLLSNKDALTSDCQRIVASSQQWYKKPTSLGGGGNAFTGLTLAKLGINAANQNGDYTLTVDSATQITCVGDGTEKTSAGPDVKVTMVYDAVANTFTTTNNM